MRYEVDQEHKTVDLYIRDCTRNEIHECISFKEFQKLVEDITWDIKNPTGP